MAVKCPIVNKANLLYFTITMGVQGKKKTVFLKIILTGITNGGKQD